MKILTPSASGMMPPNGLTSTYSLGNGQYIGNFQFGGTYSADFGPVYYACLPSPLDGWYQFFVFMQSTDANVTGGTISVEPVLSNTAGTIFGAPIVQLVFSGTDGTLSLGGTASQYGTANVLASGGPVTIMVDGSGFAGAAGGYVISVTVLKLA
jgi:hypothetical protein